jgi:hypothetical protein
MDIFLPTSRALPTCYRRLDFGTEPTRTDPTGCYPSELGPVLAAAANNMRMRALVPVMLAQHPLDRDYDIFNDLSDAMLSRLDADRLLLSQIQFHPNTQARYRDAMLPGYVYFNEYHHDPWGMLLLYPECAGPGSHCVATPENIVYSFFHPGQSPAYDRLVAMDAPARRSATIHMTMACGSVGVTFIGLILEASPSEIDANLVDLTYHMFDDSLHWTIFRDDLPSFPPAFLVHRRYL